MMLQSILAELDDVVDLPVMVEEVAALFRKHGDQDEIEFFEDPELDAMAFRGVHRRYTRSDGVYADPIYCTQIIYATQQSPEWMRVTCVKEMVHIADHPDNLIKDRAAVESLLDGIADPLDVKNGTLESINDHLAVIPAIALLLPKTARQILRERCAEKRMTFQEAAELAKVPERWMEWALSDRFEEALSVVLKTRWP